MALTLLIEINLSFVIVPSSGGRSANTIVFRWKPQTFIHWFTPGAIYYCQSTGMFLGSATKPKNSETLELGCGNNLIFLVIFMLYKNCFCYIFLKFHGYSVEQECIILSWKCQCGCRFSSQLHKSHTWFHLWLKTFSHSGPLRIKVDILVLEQRLDDV